LIIYVFMHLCPLCLFAVVSPKQHQPPIPTGKLVHRNPELVVPTLRTKLVQLLTKMECFRSTNIFREREQARGRRRHRRRRRSRRLGCVNTYML
jgi:hypothetical protein